MAEHSPAPWTLDEVGPDALPVVIDARGQDVAWLREGAEPFTWSRPREVIEANANLIIAAPDLLAALESVNNWLDDLTLAQPAVSRQGMREAIAKARGTS